MRVLLLSTTFGRFDSRIFYREAKALADAGHDVTILCSDLGKEELVDRINIISTYKQLSGRLNRFLFTIPRIKRRVKTLPFDIVQISNPESLPLAKYFKKRGKKVIFDSREDYSAFITEKPWIPRFLRKLVAFFYEKYENSCLKYIDSVVVVTPFIQERFAQKHPRVNTVTNYPLLTEEVDNKTEISSVFNICFFGTISNDDLHANLMEAIRDIPSVKYHLLSAGNDADNAKLVEQSRQTETEDKVTLYPKIEYSKIPAFLQDKNIGVILRRYAANYGYHRGSLGVIKFFQYMASGLPVLCTDFDEWKNIVIEYKCGICVNPFDIEQIRTAIRHFIDNPEETKKMGENARKAFQTVFNWSTQEKIYIHSVID